VDCGLWTVDCGLWTVDCGLWTVWPPSSREARLEPHRTSGSASSLARAARESLAGLHSLPVTGGDRLARLPVRT
jgi:hypothetical protein